LAPREAAAGVVRARRECADDRDTAARAAGSECSTLVDPQEHTMAKTLYMVIENFKGGDAVPVYRRFRDQGRLAPPGLTYISSWVDTQFQRCYQLMEADDPQLLDDWVARWSDIVDFEVHPVITSAEAAEKISPRL
jgi:hypothetical protein